MVKEDVAALLEVQSDDLRIYGIEDRLGELLPRMQALEKDRQRADESLQQARRDVESEEQKQGDLQDRLRQHRELLTKSENLLGQVTTPREAAAAMAQIEQAKRFIADEERDMAALTQRLKEGRQRAADREQVVRDIEARQVEARDALAADRASLEQALKDAHAIREQKARKVPRSLLQRYDRIRSKRRAPALYPLRGHSCANCDTAIPVQRHSTMASTGTTEPCEACGVLLYAAIE